MKTYRGPLDILPDNSIFVFGSNTQGRHGLGAALWARLNAGAIYGVPNSIQGNSYAIITKDISSKPYKSMNKDFIIIQIEILYNYCHNNNGKSFLVAYMDKPNLNGYTPQEMVDMFKAAAPHGNYHFIPSNIIFEESFAKLF